MNKLLREFYKQIIRPEIVKLVNNDDSNIDDYLVECLDMIVDRLVAD